MLLGGDCAPSRLEVNIKSLINKGFCYLVYLDNDYGGDFAALCRSVEVEELPNE